MCRKRGRSALTGLHKERQAFFIINTSLSYFSLFKPAGISKRTLLPPLPRGRHARGVDIVALDAGGRQGLRWRLSLRCSVCAASAAPERSRRAGLSPVLSLCTRRGRCRKQLTGSQAEHPVKIALHPHATRKLFCSLFAPCVLCWLLNNIYILFFFFHSASSEKRFRSYCEHTL